ncbi:Ig-like domain-containing protein [Thermophagus sp. OGC60D27]|uniref:Ig-like domain-containing protein n=1 Tax=Thermophagus sp. OGC60D27 TaxID=3458415 RepID=UPI004037C172
MKTSLPFFCIFFLLLIWGCSDKEEGSEPEPQAPKVTILSPEDGDQFKKGSLIPFEIEASDVDGNILLVDLRISGESVYHWESGPFVYDMDTRDMEVGEYTVECVVEDDQGKSSKEMVTITITEEDVFDPDAPKVSIISPKDGDIFEKGATIPFEIEASDENGNILLVDLLFNGNSVHHWEDEPYTVNWDSNYHLEIGENTVEVSVDDDQGKSSKVSITITITESAAGNYIINGTLKSAETNTFLDNIEILFGELTATTDVDGKFSFENNEVGISTLTSDVSGEYIPIQYSWEFEGNETYDISLIAYPKVSGINSQNSDFIKGVSLFDAGPWMGQELYPEAFEQTFERLEDMNANTVTVFDPVFVTAVGNDSVAMSTKANTYYDWEMLSQSQYQSLSDKASERNLNMMYWFGVWPQDEEKLDGKSFNEIVFSGGKLSDAFWEDWFSEYARILKEYAQTAESKGVEWISLGHGLSYATSPDAFSSESLYETHWNDLISEVRSVYSGKIAYFGVARPFTADNYEGGSEWQYFEDDSYTDSFVDLFDAFGIVVSSITEITNPSVSQIKDAMTGILNHFSGFSKPLILWVWAPSVDGAANTYGHLEPVLDVSASANNWAVDFYEQADLYHGILQAVNESSVDIQGVISHGYMYYDRFTKYEPRDMNTAFEKAASVRGKPAEKIISHWFDGF